jgi:hypothetical protein
MLASPAPYAGACAGKRCDLTSRHGGLVRRKRRQAHQFGLAPDAGFGKHRLELHAHRDKGDLDHAIADYSAAIAIDPDHSAAGGFFRDRAAAYRAKGEAARAAAD